VSGSRKRRGQQLAVRVAEREPFARSVRRDLRVRGGHDAVRERRERRVIEEQQALRTDRGACRGAAIAAIEPQHGTEARQPVGESRQIEGRRSIGRGVGSAGAIFRPRRIEHSVVIGVEVASFVVAIAHAQLRVV